MTEKIIEYATLGRRMVGAVIDSLIITVFLTPICKMLEYILIGKQDLLFYMQQYTALHNNADINAAELMDFLIVVGALQKWLFIQMLSILFIAIYCVYFWYTKNATPGKMLTKCVILKNNQEKPSLSDCIIRFLSYFVSILILCFGFIMALFTKKHQTLHDKIASTVVIKINH